MTTNHEAKKRKPGRPRATPEDRIEEMMSLYKSGLGYRAIARELENEGIVVTYSTVRRVIKACTDKVNCQSSPDSNSDTIL